MIMKIAVANAMYKLPLASIGALGGTDIMPVCKPLHGAACLKIRLLYITIETIWGLGSGAPTFSRLRQKLQGFDT